MHLIKKINNNYAVATDSSGEIIIVSGNGIGFGKFPSELEDLSKISRTYYNVDTKFVNLINELPEEVIKISTQIVDYAEENLRIKLNPNLVFTLADHINFAASRIKKGLTFDSGINFEINYLHAEEYAISKEAVRLIQKKLDISFPKSEVAILAMHLVEAEDFNEEINKNPDITQIVDDLANMIRNKFNVVIDSENFHYYRFATHIQYLISRRNDDKEISSDNRKLFESMVETYPLVYECVLEIQEYFKSSLKWEISDEEKMYLIIHINRICSKEDCYQ